MIQFALTKGLLLLIYASMPTNAASGSYYEPTYSMGSYSLTNPGNSATDLLYAQAAVNPNATRSVKFHPFPWFHGSSPEKYRDVEWEWRVNVSDLAPPDVRPETRDGAPLLDPHVALTTYDFRWPGSGNLSTQVGGGPDAVCISTAVSYTWPGNLTNRYAEGDTASADCGTVLGAACRDAILRNGSGYVTGNRRSCHGTGTPWNTLPECTDSFGYSHNLTRRLDPNKLPTVLTYDINRGNGTQPNPEWGNWTRVPGGTNPVSGTGFFAFNSFPRNATNETEYDEATNRLHVVMLNTMLPTGDGNGYQRGGCADVYAGQYDQGRVGGSGQRRCARCGTRPGGYGHCRGGDDAGMDHVD
ncbi:uncharacterized protein PG986_003897 [Apiospora aurea]|uniref:Uncharacterized protein n=1 Tax=Apiospora aurea TaxID=335848 RepID=A0ABR1QL22_9PEZI